MLTTHLIAAARPNFMKVAPLYHALTAETGVNPKIVHTGQHYDINMSDVFFNDLGLPKPDFHLGVGSGSHAEQTGSVMIAYEKTCFEHRPDCIVVVGDVNSTAACAMVGSKMWIPVIHLEAGLRSGDRRMPEEINRLVTDAISDVLWTPSADANENLRNEGVPESKIDLIGNIMIDSFEMMKDKIAAANTTEGLGLTDQPFALVTLHRPSNVDDRDNLKRIVDALISISLQCQVVFVAHPRTIKQIDQFGLRESIASASGFKLLNPLPYVEFMNVVTHSSLVITDSGGLQEETTYLGIPCLTLRENTERPITITLGTNQLLDASEVEESAARVISGGKPEGQVPPLWDGKTAQRATESLMRRFG